MKPYLLLLLLLVSCGNNNERQVELVLQLPAPLAKGTGRHKRFLARASHLVISAGSFEQTYPVQAWDSLRVEALSGEDFDVEARVFDRDGEGRVRRDPALKGKTQIKKGEATARLKLHLELSPREYD